MHNKKMAHYSLGLIRKLSFLCLSYTSLSSLTTTVQFTLADTITFESSIPTPSPTSPPSPSPTPLPTPSPTLAPRTPLPTRRPTRRPTSSPTTSPTPNPTALPTTSTPSSTPSSSPTSTPTSSPTCTRWGDDLPFTYDYTSSRGPRDWRKVDTCGNEWEEFVDKEHVDLDVDENECRSDRRPSPVNLRANSICDDEHEILTRRRMRSDCQIEDMTFTIHPGTLRGTWPRTDGYCNRPSVDLPNGYPHRWIMQWMEVHVRSEHMLDGRRYDAELQMMHLGTEKQDDVIAMISMMIDASATKDDEGFQELLDKWQKAKNDMLSSCGNGKRKYNWVQDDGMDTIASLNRTELPSGGDNYDKNVVDNDELYWGKMYQPKYGSDGPPVLTDEYIQNHTSPMPNGGTRRRRRHRRRLAFPSEHLDPRRAPRHKPWPYILWPTIHYYRYRGSLTTPPCAEMVHWRVFDETSRISRRQYRRLTNLVNSYVDPQTCKSQSITSPRGENYRPIQELGDDPDDRSATHCTDLDFTFWMYMPEDQ